MDSIVLLHRLVVGIAVALFIVSVSTERPKTDYDAAEEELRSLQDAVEAASEQVDQAGLRLDHASQLEHALRTVSYHSGTRCVAVELRNGIQFDYFLPVPVRPGVRRKEIDHKNQPRTPRMSRLLALAHRFEAL